MDEASTKLPPQASSPFNLIAAYTALIQAYERTLRLGSQSRIKKQQAHSNQEKRHAKQRL